MRILLDESVPEKLGRLLVGHTCSTVQRQGWTSAKNGKLLALAKDHFDLLLTADKGMEYQQNQEPFLLQSLWCGHRVIASKTWSAHYLQSWLRLKRFHPAHFAKLRPND